MTMIIRRAVPPGACPSKQHYCKQGASLRSKGIEHWHVNFFSACGSLHLDEASGGLEFPSLHPDKIDSRTKAFQLNCGITGQVVD